MTCLQEGPLDDGRPLRRFEFERHAWIIDGESLGPISRETPVTLTRRYRCRRCDLTREVSGEPSPRYLARA